MKANRIAALIVLSMGLFTASLPAQVGEVSFPNSGAPAAQEAFLRGLAQLHNFQYGEATEAFREARTIDPDFTMAAWGEAMTHNHPVWMEQDSAAGRAVLASFGPTDEARLAKAPTEREKAYLRALEILYHGEGGKRARDLAYAEAMRQVHEAYPDDHEAAAFYALSLLGTAHDGRDFATYMRAAALAQEVFQENPSHPGAAHYLIHSFDDPIHAPLGLPAARAYSQIAPDAPHAQHMTSHIFVAMGLWEDVIRANDTAVEVMNRTRHDHGRGPAACGHMSSWAQYALHQLGRHEEAKERVAACHRLALKAGQGDSVGAISDPLDPDNTLRGSFAGMRARYLVEAEDWDGEVLGWTAPLEDLFSGRITYEFATGYAAARRGDVEASRAALERFRAARGELDVHLAAREAAPELDYAARAEILESELRALILADEGADEEAVALLREATKREEEVPFHFGPPFVDKPSHELLGEVLLETGRPDEAEESFRTTLDRAPARRLAEEGLRRAEGVAAR